METINYIVTELMPYAKVVGFAISVMTVFAILVVVITLVMIVYGAYLTYKEE